LIRGQYQHTKVLEELSEQIIVTKLQQENSIAEEQETTITLSFLLQPGN
jgi:hypothetical protein